MQAPSTPTEPELREEAASWFVRMRGPDGDTLRPDFERWLAAGPDQRAAYNRIAARFSEAKLLQTVAAARSGSSGSSRPSRRPAYALASLLCMVCAGLTAYLMTNPGFRRQGPLTAQQMASFMTRHGEIRTLHLADGSVVALDTDSELAVNFTGDRRDLRLARGRARFDVAHGTRPFVVAAGGGRITARGTLFDVEIDQGHGVRVALLRGTIDVTRGSEASAAHASRRLHPGETIGIETGTVPLGAPVPAVAQSSWPTGLVDFDEASMREVIAEANRYAGTPIIVPDPELQVLNVSGRFGVRNTGALAANLARLFDLTVDRSQPHAIILRKPAG